MLHQARINHRMHVDRALNNSIEYSEHCSDYFINYDQHRALILSRDYEDS